MIFFFFKNLIDAAAQAAPAVDQYQWRSAKLLNGNFPEISERIVLWRDQNNALPVDQEALQAFRRIGTESHIHCAGLERVDKIAVYALAENKTDVFVFVVFIKSLYDRRQQRVIKAGNCSNFDNPF